METDNMYVITGSSGHTGGVLASHLLAAGKQVRGIGRSADRMQRLAQKGGEPFIADLTDSAALTRAFQGATAVYVMIPPEMGTPDLLASQQAVTEAIATALESAGVKYALSLSSIGADKTNGTGPVVGLHRMEERLNRIAGLNVLHLRCGYFMENTLMLAETVRKTGNLSGPLDPQLPLPMIATRDIGDAAAQAMIHLHFTGHQTQELQGLEDITMRQVAAILGHVMGKPDLKYVQAADEQVRAGLLQMGASEDFAAKLLEMSHALNSGYMRALEPRSESNTTPTSFSTFAHQEFLPAFRRRAA
jgi:uncharacterized protein YbjT (DUF2867 family)